MKYYTSYRCLEIIELEESEIGSNHSSTIPSGFIIINDRNIDVISKNFKDRYISKNTDSCPGVKKWIEKRQMPISLNCVYDTYAEALKAKKNRDIKDVID